jgi:stage II sporulation protein P
LGVITGSVIALLSGSGPGLRAGVRRLVEVAGQGLGGVAPAARFLFATDQNLAREIVREQLPLRQASGGPVARVWLDRLVQGVTGLDPAAPESFLRQTLLARGGGRSAAGRPEGSETDLVPALGQNTPGGAVRGGQDPAGPGPGGPSATTPGTGAGTGAGDRQAEQPVPPIPRRTGHELRRFPWGTSPLIAVYHTHSSEAYHGPSGHAKGKSYSGSDYVWGKTTGLIAVGDELGRVLTEDYRIPVVHSRNIHDYPIFRDAYANSATTAREILRKYPSVRLLLDLHRDGLADVDRDFITTVMGGERLARISLVVGRGQPGLPNPHWEKNLALAQRLHAKMEEMYPGLSRGVTVRNWPYNQELSDRALLLEIGDHYNTKEEALKSAALLADCLAALLADLGG